MQRQLVEPLENRCLLSGNGLVGYYYNGTSETTRVMTRNDTNINFNFGSAAPVPQITGSYSIKWQGQILPPTTGIYTFYVDATDGVQLSVRGTQIINRWSDGSGELTGTIALSGGQMVDLELDYFNDTANGNVQLYWSAPGISKQTIPNADIYNTFGVDYTITNPIAPSGADPWVTYENGEYYYAYSDGGALYVSASATLEGIGTASGTKIYQPPAGTMYSEDLWAPELHYISGLWYVYFAADNGNNDNHRMYVLQSTGQNPQGLYNFKGEIEATADKGVPTATTAFPIDHWAIDGTVVTIGSSNYFVWSGWDGTDPNGQSQVQQNLYIALMSNPWTISGSRYVLSQPTYSWEQNGLPINEGPEELAGPTGKVFVIYSASGYWTNQYCLGQLEYNAGNPLLQSSWIKSANPVFQQAGSVTGVGHASFTTSPDGTQDWIVYHAHSPTFDSTGIRDIHTQQFTFNADGTPNFGSPVQDGVALEEPSGTPHYTPNFNYPVYPAAPQAIVATSAIVHAGTLQINFFGMQNGAIGGISLTPILIHHVTVVTVVVPPPPPVIIPPVKIATIASTVLQSSPFSIAALEGLAALSGNLASVSVIEMTPEPVRR
ncbi:MAG TPA: family 43 glycosylhydrolase [Tepidisphaeraceae bacterium]|jgi:GH43 family beta-xylosidase